MDVFRSRPNDRVALITGSTSGIGLAVARTLARAGYALTIHGLEPDGPQLARALELEYGVRVAHSSANLAEAGAVRELVLDAEGAFGRLDVLVNNAGIQYVAPVEDFPLEKWNAILAVNLTACFVAAQAAWPGMKKRGFGRIVNMASVHGLVASEFKSAYVAAKHGLVGLTKDLALEGAPHGITANALCPGYVRTPLVDRQLDEQAAAHGLPRDEVVRKIMLAKQPVKEFIAAEAVAELALFLASDAAAAVTGAVWPIDGGWTAQ